MISRIANYSALVVLAPICMSVIAYTGFTTNYSRGTFSPESFRASYGHSVFKYRIIGRDALLAFHQRFRGTFDKFPPDPRLKVVDPKANAGFYAAYFLFNTFFLILATAALALFLGLFARSHNRYARNLMVLAALTVMAFSQFVVTPYDNLANFLLLTMAILYMLPGSWSWIIAALLMIPATLNRESSAILPAFAWALYFQGHGLRVTKNIIKPAVVSAAFIGTFIGVRIIMGGPGDTVLNWFIAGNLKEVFIIGLVVIAYASLALVNPGPAHRRLAGLFLLFCAPYLALAFFFGVISELRIFVPPMLFLLCLSAMDPDKLPGASSAAED